MTEASQLDWLHSHFHAIAHVIQIVGFGMIGASIVRFVRAPSRAARKGGQVATFEPGGGVKNAPEFVSIDLERLKRVLPVRADDRQGFARESGPYASTRGLTDFYRMQAGLAALAGLVLVIITLVAW